MALGPPGEIPMKTLLLALLLCGSASAGSVDDEWRAKDELALKTAMEDMAAGEKAADDALAFAKKAFGENDARTAASYTLLGEILRAQKDWKGAEKVLRRGMKIRDEVLPPLDSDHEQ